MAKQNQQIEEKQAKEGFMFGNNDNGLLIEFPKSFAKQNVFYCSTTNRNGTIKEERIVPINKSQFEKLTNQKTQENSFLNQLKNQFGSVEHIHII